jgi:hypothetical protein
MLVIAYIWHELKGAATGTCGIARSREENVGAPGFEPGTSCSQSRRANQAALRPVTSYLQPETLLPQLWCTSRSSSPDVKRAAYDERKRGSDGVRMDKQRAR